MVPLDSIYSHLWTAHGDEFSLLDGSLGPRSWIYLFDVAAAVLRPGSMVADIGCGRGNHCFELVRRFDCRVAGIDLLLPPLRTAARDPERGSNIEFVQGDIGRLPLRTAAIDFVWCRDMLVHVRDLAAATAECFRILRPRGSMLAWVTCATELMEPREAARLYAPLGIEPSSVSREQLEAAFARAGFTVSGSEMLGSELIEFYEERDGRASRELMRIARMRRLRNRLTAEWGPLKYDTAHALYHWMVYHLLGKLSSGYYLLEKPAA